MRVADGLISVAPFHLGADGESFVDNGERRKYSALMKRYVGVVSRRGRGTPFVGPVSPGVCEERHVRDSGAPGFLLLADYERHCRGSGDGGQYFGPFRGPLSVCVLDGD